VLFTFPSRYLFTIGLSVVFSLARWSWPLLTGFLVPRHTQGPARIINLSCTGLSPPTVGFSKTVPLQFIPPSGSPTTPTLPKQRWFGLFPFRSPLLRKSLLFSFPVGNEMFQFPTFAFRLPGISACAEGFPHSGTCGSIRICQSPQIFAACHALLRL
jgi:hypothetical protein